MNALKTLWFGLRLAVYAVHSLTYFILSGKSGFFFVAAIFGLWLLFLLPEQRDNEALMLVAGMGIMATIIPWFLARWILWPISEPKFPPKPRYTPKPARAEAPPAPRPQPMPSPPSFQRPRDTVVRPTDQRRR